MSWQQTYRDKLVSMDEIVKYVHNGDRIVIQSGDAASYPILNALYENRNNYKDVEVYSQLMTAPSPLSRPECNGKIRLVSCFLSGGERNGIADGTRIGVGLIQLHDTLRSWREKIHPNCAIIQVSPPDENGYVSLGTNSTGIPEVKELFTCILAQVNNDVPMIKGPYSMLHVDEITAFVECNEELPVEQNRQPSKKDEAIAGFIVERVDDGACIQLGAGGIPTAVGTFLKTKKHLGIHTEMFAESMVDLIECGAVDNSRKKILPGKSVFVFSGVTPKHRKFFKEHPELMETRSFEWVNDPYIIGQNDNVLAINSGLCCDLTGQVCSESIGTKQYSGIGGQLDFVRGARISKNGKSFITMYSTYTDKQGKMQSKINLTLPAGSAVTTPRTDVQYIVTEYGVADLNYETLETRAKRLIAIAHPDFRDELYFNAKKLGWIY